MISQPKITGELCQLLQFFVDSHLRLLAKIIEVIPFTAFFSLPQVVVDSHLRFLVKIIEVIPFTAYFSLPQVVLY